MNTLTVGDEAPLFTLLDENNNYTNGQNIVVDGGFTAW